MLEVIDIEGQKMEKVKNIIIRVTDKLEESCVLGYQAGDDHDDPAVGGWLYVGNVS